MPTADPRLSLTLLGPPMVAVSGRPVRLATRKALALLAYLAVRRDGAARSDLAALLWPEHGEEQARRSLRQELSRLGRVLGPARLQAGRELVALAGDGLDVDLWAFQAARTEGRHADAAALYRGPLLAGLFLKEAAPFERWLESTREALQRQVLESLGIVATQLEAQGRHAEALAVARRAIAIDPLAEEFYLQAMRLAFRTGDRSQALRTFQDLERMLREELGVGPTPEARALAHDIAAGTVPVAPLPAPPGSLLGREEELEHVETLLGRGDCRLLVLVGPGGVGKTRLALEVAHRLQARGTFPDGVCWIGAIGPHLFPTLADALGLPLYGRGDLQAAVAHRLRNRHVLLVLDEADELGDETVLIERVLEAAPSVTVLATARERLRLRAEWVYHLHGLPVPVRPAEAERNPAAALFRRAAERARPAFRPTAQDREAMAAICTLVGGLPLALELAGSWVRLLTCEEIRAELTRSLDLLEVAVPHLPPRQRSLRAVVDSMLTRLMPEEAAALVRLSVFQGGFTLEAARAVAGVGAPLLSALDDRSVLDRPAPGRYAVLEMARQRLAPTIPDAVREAHAAYVAAFLLEREDLLKGGRQPEALAEIGSDLRNVRAAWQWAVGAGRPELIRPMVDPLFLFHELRGWFQEGADLFQSALALPDPGLRAAVRARVGRFAYRLGRYPEAEAALEAALADARVAGALFEEAFALNNLGLVALGLGRPSEAREHLRRTLHLVREAGNRWAAANALYNLGLTAMALGAYADARSHFQEALDLYQELRDARGTSLALSGLGQALGVTGEGEAAHDLFARGAVVGERLQDPFATATALLGAGGLALLRGDLPAARRLLHRSLETFRTVGDRGGIVRALTMLGHLARRTDRHEEAEGLFGEAVELARQSGFRWGEALGLAGLAQTLSARGKMDDARRHLAQALETAAGLALVPLLLRVLFVASELVEEVSSGVRALLLAHPGTEHEIRLALRGGPIPEKAPEGFADLPSAVATVRRHLDQAAASG